MLKQRMSLIALGILSASTAMANDQDQSKGFVEDSHLNIAARNAYISRDYKNGKQDKAEWGQGCLLYTSPSPRDRTRSRMPSSA